MLDIELCFVDYFEVGDEIRLLLDGENVLLLDVLIGLVVKIGWFNVILWGDWKGFVLDGIFSFLLGVCMLVEYMLCDLEWERVGDVMFGF